METSSLASLQAKALSQRKWDSWIIFSDGRESSFIEEYRNVTSSLLISISFRVIRLSLFKLYASARF